MLGIQASSALAWMLLELGIVSVAMYVMSIKSNLKMLDMLSYSGYKFIGYYYTFACFLGMFLHQLVAISGL